MSRATGYEMELRCPDCASPEVALIDRGSRLECGNCGTEFGRDEAFVSVADAEAYAAEYPGCTSEEQVPLFQFDLRRASHGINDPNGAIWPVNSFTDADELNSLFEAAVHSGIIASRDQHALIHIYPLAISDPEPVVAVSGGNGPSMLGYSLKLRERDGESPLEFTLRLLEETTIEAKWARWVRAWEGTRGSLQLTRSRNRLAWHGPKADCIPSRQDLVSTLKSDNRLGKEAGSQCVRQS